MTTPRHLSDRYELGETLGFGGMSEVHLAHDRLLDREVAIKVLRADLARDPTFYLRFRREAQNAAALQHPTIVQVFDTGEAQTPTGPLPFIVMEYVDGETLRDVLRRDGRVSPRQAMTWFADVCAAIDFSHQNGIVHRDIKPANVMVDKIGAIKVMDFGIARAMNDTTNTMTQTAAVIGTAQYLSPEQARGEKVDARSDVYSLGCVLFELVTGEPPFTGDTPLAVAYQHVREDPPTPSKVFSGVPRELDSIILKAMSKNRDNRYQSAAAMRSDLLKVLAGGQPSAPIVMSEEDRAAMLAARPGRLAPEPSDPDNPRRRWPVLIGAAVALLLVVGIVLALLQPWKSDTATPVAVPDVLQLDSAQAQAALKKAGFEVETRAEPNNTIPQDRPIRTTPAPGVKIAAGSKVTLFVSSGPKRVQLPEVVGQTPDAVRKKLSDLGITQIRQSEGPSSEQLTGKVIDLSPTPGATVSVLDRVTIVVGTGPEKAQVPEVVGQQVDAVRSQLTKLGFVISITEIDSPEPAGTIVAVAPEAGIEQVKGATVTLTVSRGNQFTMPDLDGLTVTQARKRLTDAGWTGATINQTPRNVPLGSRDNRKVMSQTIPQGTVTDKNVTVEVTVGRETLFP